MHIHTFCAHTYIYVHTYMSASEEERERQIGSANQHSLSRQSLMSLVGLFCHMNRSLLVCEALIGGCCVSRQYIHTFMYIHVCMYCIHTFMHINVCMYLRVSTAHTYVYVHTYIGRERTTDSQRELAELVSPCEPLPEASTPVTIVYSKRTHSIVREHIL